MSPLSIRTLGDVLANSVSQLGKRVYFSSGDDTYDYWYENRTLAIVIIIVIPAVVVGGTLLCWLIALIVFYSRQQKRKKWYGPMAQYYQAMGWGRAGAYGYNGGMYAPQPLYVPYGSQSYPPQVPPGAYMPYPQGQPMGQDHQSQFQNTNVTYGNNVADPYGAGYGNGGGGGYGTRAKDLVGGMSEKETSDLKGSTAYDPFASPHTQGSSHLPSRSQSEYQSHGNPEQRSTAESHGVPGVHGVRKSSEKADAGAIGGTGGAGAINPLSFYTSAIPTGSHPHVAGAGAGPPVNSKNLPEPY